MQNSKLKPVSRPHWEKEISSFMLRKGKEENLPWAFFYSRPHLSHSNASRIRNWPSGEAAFSPVNPSLQASAVRNGVRRPRGPSSCLHTCCNERPQHVQSLLPEWEGLHVRGGGTEFRQRLPKHEKTKLMLMTHCYSAAATQHVCLTAAHSEVGPC